MPLCHSKKSTPYTALKVRVKLDTITEIANFVVIANTIPSNVYLTNGADLKVDAKSFLGVAYTREFAELWCECEEDIYTKIEQFVTTGETRNEQ